MLHEELIELSYVEFTNRLATARAKRKMRCRLTQEDRYLLEHCTSIEVQILEREERINYAVPRAAHGLSDGTGDGELTVTTWTHVGTLCRQLPSKRLWKKRRK